MKKLSSINDFDIYVVEKVLLPSETKKRLGELGIVRGTKIRFLFAAPSGEPKAYLVRGAQLALRSKYTENILVSKESEFSKEVLYD